MKKHLIERNINFSRRQRFCLLWTWSRSGLFISSPGWKGRQCVIVAQDHLQGVLFYPNLHIGDKNSSGAAVNICTALRSGISLGTLYWRYWCFLQDPVWGSLAFHKVSHIWLILITALDNVWCLCSNKTSAKSLCSLTGERLGRDCWLFFNTLIKPFGITAASSFTQLSEQVLSMHKDSY